MWILYFLDTDPPGKHNSGQPKLFQKTKPDKNVPVRTRISRACLWAGCVGFLPSNRKIRAYWNTEGSARSGKVECPCRYVLVKFVFHYYPCAFLLHFSVFMMINCEYVITSLKHGKLHWITNVRVLYKGTKKREVKLCPWSNE